VTVLDIAANLGMGEGKTCTHEMHTCLIDNYALCIVVSQTVAHQCATVKRTGAHMCTPVWVTTAHVMRGYLSDNCAIVHNYARNKHEHCAPVWVKSAHLGEC
jgi:hypothetical protein